MKQVFIFSFLLFSVSITVRGQVIAQKLAVQQKQEMQKGCDARSFWIRGHWQWDKASQEYQWREGRCEAHRKGYTYIPGRWQKVEEGWKWQDGYWKKL
ncbi:MAG: YXWGXW repeat-containing protein [Bacteroidota bacterium]